MTQQQPKVTFELNVNQLNVVLGALAKQPLEAVYEVFTALQQQASQQLQAPSSAGPLADKVIE